MVYKNKSGQVLIEMVFMLLLFTALLKAFDQINRQKNLRTESHKISRTQERSFKQ